MVWTPIPPRPFGRYEPGWAHSIAREMCLFGSVVPRDSGLSLQVDVLRRQGSTNYSTIGRGVGQHKTASTAPRHGRGILGPFTESVGSNTGGFQLGPGGSVTNDVWTRTSSTGRGTIAVLFRRVFTGTAANFTPIWGWNDTTTSPFRALTINDANVSAQLRAGAAIGGSNYVCSVDWSTIGVDIPHFVVVTYDGTLLRLYVDGVQRATGGVAGSLSGHPTGANAGMSYGGGYASTAEAFRGEMYGAWIGDAALSAESVRRWSLNPWQIARRELPTLAFVASAPPAPSGILPNSMMRMGIGR